MGRLVYKLRKLTTEAVNANNESSPTSSASADSCPDCGAQAGGGCAGCQNLSDELAAQAFTDLSTPRSTCSPRQQTPPVLTVGKAP